MIRVLRLWKRPNFDDTVMVNDRPPSAYLYPALPCLHAGIQKSCSLGYTLRTAFLSPPRGKSPDPRQRVPPAEAGVDPRCAACGAETLRGAELGARLSTLSEFIVMQVRTWQRQLNGAHSRNALFFSANFYRS